MNSINMIGEDFFPQAFFHAGYILTACAFIVRKILWLRLIAILANFSVGTAALFAASGARWDVVAWTAAFIAINIGHSAWLMYERHLASFTDDEKKLRDTTFQGLDTVAVRKLIRRGEWHDFTRDDCIARQGVHLDRLILIAEGEAVVLLGGSIVARLRQGDFVGEIAFLTEEEATASVVVVQELRCVVWPSDELKKSLKRYPYLLNAVHAAIGRDLAAKTAAHNLKLSQV